MKEVTIPLKILSDESKEEIHLRSVSIQLMVQGLFTEEILTHRHALKKSKFYRQRFKKLLNTAEDVVKHNDLYVAHSFCDELDTHDEELNAWLDVVREQRMTMYYAIANYYAKQNHPYRGEITIVEYLRTMASILKLVLFNINERHKALNITRAILGNLAIDQAFTAIFEMTGELRKQLRYKPISVDDDESFKISCHTLARKIKQYLYEGENFKSTEIDA